MSVGIRIDPLTGKARWYCSDCHAGTGVAKSGDVGDRTPVEVAQRSQWEPEAEARRGRLGHRITHREHRGFVAVASGKRPTPSAFGRKPQHEEAGDVQ